RTEFLFLDDSERAPSEEKQVSAYRQVLEAFPEGRVVVRVLDAGADKPLAFLTPADEPNPALGVRGLRTLLDHPDV
ncbi:phosphoenolpyruvate--protein phosphotransferase, partial [Streptomyces sp. TRM76130]|nr:phosphoenolpyruvate--protein phosphotransferase [Streptomyces sp. TRM76130]